MKEIPELEAKIAAAIAADGSDETPGVENLVEEITGPQNGLIYKPGPNGAPGHLVVAEGWAPDAAGNIVKLEDVNGPGTGKVCHDGKIVDAK